MMNGTEWSQKISVVIAPDAVDLETAERIKHTFMQCPEGLEAHPDSLQNDSLTLILDAEGLSLHSGDQVLKGDFTRMIPRIKNNNLPKELLVRAAKIKDSDGPLTAIDATAGLGEDSLLLAAAGFHVTLFEKNPVIYELLTDALRRAAEIPELSDIAARMHAFHGDSIEGMRLQETAPDVILLDPMFPERQKSALVKKKLQMIQNLEIPCMDETELLKTAMEARPKKLIVKRPPKGPYLAGIKPDYSSEGKAVRFDCFVSPYDRLQKFKFE